MTKPAKRTRTIELSQIRKMFEITNPNAINLGIGEHDFNVPENIKKIEEAESLSKFIESQLLNGDVDDVEALHRVELAGSTRAAFEA